MILLATVDRTLLALTDYAAALDSACHLAVTEGAALHSC